MLRSLPVHSSPVGIFSFFTVSDLRRILFSGGWFHDLLPQSFFSLFILLSTDCRTFTHNPGNIGKNPGLSPDCHCHIFAGIDYLCLYMTITDKVFPHTFTLFSLRRRTTIRHRERPPDQTPGYHMELMYKSEVMVMDSIERNPQIRIISTGRRCRIYVAAKGSYLNRISGDRKEVAPTRTFHHRSESKKAITEKR